MDNDESRSSQEKSEASAPEIEPLSLTKDQHLTKIPNEPPRFFVDRNVFTHEALIQTTGYRVTDKSIIFTMKRYYANLRFWAALSSIVPILKWLPAYKWKKYFIKDLISGITVAVMHIPQGLAYGILAGVSAGSGLYMAFFPVIVYAIFGTSRHISIGTFSVISMMTVKVVNHYANTDIKGNVFTPIQVVCATSIVTGLTLLAMSFLRLGSTANLLNDPLVNGFTAASAIHVIVGQLRELIGVPNINYPSTYKLLLTVENFFRTIPHSNLVVVIFSSCVIFFMIICNELIKPWMRKICRFPFPAELLVVVFATLISRYLNLKETESIRTVGHIPPGLPPPFFPPVELFFLVYVDAIAIAFVSYSIVVSLGFIFAKRHHYEVKPNQELFAMALSNLVGGCFSCIPICCSLSRSIMQEQTGGVTQMASFVSALLILITLLWIGPFFETLPKCVLAGIIVVALKTMLFQVKDFKKFSQQGKLELLSWSVAFFATLIFDVIIGLVAGLCISLLAIYIKGLKPSSCMLGVLSPGDDIYLNLSHHKNAKEVPNTKIFRYSGSLNFATKNAFRRYLYESINLDSEKLRRASLPTFFLTQPEEDRIKCLVLDFSGLGHLDVAGCEVLNDIRNDFKIIGIRIFIGEPCDKVYNSLMHYVTLGNESFEVFPTLHDAVLYSQACLIA